MEKRNVEQDLVAIVPAVKGAVPGVVVQHGHVEVLVVEGDVCVFIRGRFGGVGVVHLGTGQVGVGDVESSTDHERLAGVPLRVLRVPRVDDLERVWVQLADDNVPRVLVGGIHSPQAQLICHQVNVREPSPGVRVHVMETRRLQGPLRYHTARLKAVPNDDVALHLIVVQRAVVHHVVGSGPFERQIVSSGFNSRHKVSYGFVLFDYLVVGIAVHVPNLGTNMYKQDTEIQVSAIKTHL